MADYPLAVIGDRLSALVEREAPDVRLHILVVRGPLAAEAEELIRRIDGIVSPPLGHSAPRLGAGGELSGRAVLHHRHGPRRPDVIPLAEKLAAPLDLRVMPCPGASEAIVEALWCEDYDDDPAHRWLRQNLQMLAAEV